MNPPRPPRPLVPALLTSLLFLPLASSCGGGSGAQARTGESPAIRRREAARVRTAPVVQREMVRTLSTTTTVESENEIQLFPRQSGVVDKVLVEEGDRVTTGTVLAVLDDRAASEALADAQVALEDAENAVKRLEISVREAEERTARAKLTWEQAVREYERNEETGLLSAVEVDRLRLTRDTSQLDYESAKLAHEGALAELDTQATAIKRANVAVKQRELEKSFTRLVAPFDGVVAARSIRVGDTVSTGAPAFTLTDTDHLRAVVYRPQRELAFFQAAGRADGEDVQVTVWPEAVPDTEYDGEIRILSPTIDPESGSFRLTIDLEQPGAGDPRPRLLPGMLVRLDIVTERHPDALVVPKRALRRDGDEYSLFVVRDDVAHEVAIREGFSDDEYVEVHPEEGAELAVGDRVVVVGNRDLEDAAEVRAESWDEGEREAARSTTGPTTGTPAELAAEDTSAAEEAEAREPDPPASTDDASSARADEPGEPGEPGEPDASAGGVR